MTALGAIATASASIVVLGGSWLSWLCARAYLRGRRVR